MLLYLVKKKKVIIGEMLQNVFGSTILFKDFKFYENTF
jgi:hypothetical protein